MSLVKILFICFLKISANDNLNPLKIVFQYDIKDFFTGFFKLKVYFSYNRPHHHIHKKIH